MNNLTEASVINSDWKKATLRVAPDLFRTAVILAESLIQEDYYRHNRDGDLEGLLKHIEDYGITVVSDPSLKEGEWKLIPKS